MKVQEVRITNVGGIAQLTLKPEQITTLVGKNGSGKSSALAALRVALEGGDLAGLARVGSEEPPEVVLVLDDGTRIRRRGKAGAVVEVPVSGSDELAQVRKPQSYLDSLFDSRLSANPVRFLTADPGEVAELLLAALPVDLDAAGLWEELPAEARHAIRPATLDQVTAAHPLRVLSSLRQDIYEARRDVNRAAKDKEASAAQLRAALPPDVATRDWQGELQAAERALAEGRAGVDSVRKLAAARAKAETERAEAMFRHAEEALRHALDVAMAAAHSEYDRNLSAAQAALASAKEEIESGRRDVEADMAKAEPVMLALAADASAARSRAEEAARAKSSSEMAQRFADEAIALQAKATALSAALQTIDEKRAALAENLPIAGLAIEGKAITLDGIPWEQVNQSRRIHVAAQVAALRSRARGLRTLLLDGSEALDPDHYRLLLEELAAEGVQVIVARVATGELRTVNGIEAAVEVARG